MVIEFLASIVFGVVAFFISLFPSLPSFSGLNGSVSSLLHALTYVNAFINLRHVANCIIIVLFVYNVKFIWSIIMWFIRKLPLGVS